LGGDIIDKLIKIYFILTTGLKRVPKKIPKLSDTRTHMKHIRSIITNLSHSKGWDDKKYDTEMCIVQ
jgi:hypothetical protein